MKKYALIVVLFFTGFAAFAQMRYAIIPQNPRPGEPVTLALKSGGMKITAAALAGENGSELSRALFFTVPGEGDAQPFIAAVLTVPSTAPGGKALINLKNGEIIVGSLSLEIAPRDFVAEEIELTPSLTALRTEPDPKKTAESNQLWAILGRTGSELYHLGNFTPPVTSTRRTSFFGDRRVFKYSNGKRDTSIHAGVDFGVPTGTPVSACAPGKVVLARIRITTGNSVVLEHLPGVYSLYYHLDKIEVKEGDMVSAGTQLGLSGATGLATGPHLHWEIRVSGENTDPDAFVSRPILDKTAILGKIGN